MSGHRYSDVIIANLFGSVTLWLIIILQCFWLILDLKEEPEISDNEDEYGVLGGRQRGFE